VDVVNSYIPTAPSLPSQLLSGEHVKQIACSLFKEVRKKTRRAMRSVDIHSTDDSEASDTEPNGPAPQPSRLYAQPREKTARGIQTLYDETKGMLNEGTRPKGQETWDHWFPAPDTNIADEVAPEPITVDKKSTLSRPTSVSHCHKSSASIHNSQQIATAGIPQEHDSHTIDHEKDTAVEAWYYHQVTIDISKRSAKSGEEIDAETADLEQRSYANDDEDIVDISEMSARMPDDMESAPFADMQVCLYVEPGLLYTYHDFCFIKDTDGTLCCEKF
jgi:hypothetical protein